MKHTTALPLLLALAACGSQPTSSSEFSVTPIDDAGGDAGGNGGDADSLSDGGLDVPISLDTGIDGAQGDSSTPGDDADGTNDTDPGSDTGVDAGDDTTVADSGTTDTGTTDTGTTDTGTTDTGTTDSGTTDSGTTDSGTTDSGTTDTGTTDSGTTDTGTTDSGTTDSGTTDSGTADTGSDAGLVCEPASTRCVGSTLVTCADDGLSVGRTRCDATGQVCGPGPDGLDACLEPVCAAGEAFCADATTAAVCNDAGTGLASETACTDGCDPRTGECALPPDAETCDPGDQDVIAVGDTVSVDLCETGDDHQNVAGGGADCRDFNADGADFVFSLTLTEPQSVRIDLRDADNSTAIDTLLYLRASCTSPGSQTLCSDDLTCGESDITSGCTTPASPQPRHSRIEATLDAGTWYIIADQFDYRSGGTSFGCGVVSLSVQPL